MEAINFNVIDTITKLGNKLRESQMLTSKLKNTRSLTKLLCNYLGINEDECLIFVVIFIVQIQKGATNVREFNNFLGLNSIQAIRYKKIFETLAQKHLIQTNSLEISKSSHFFNGKGAYRVSPNVFESIFDNLPISKLLHENVDIYDFLRKVSRLINERDTDEFNTSDLFEAVEKLEKKNSHLDIIQNIRGLNIEVNNRTLLYEIADDFVNSGYTYLQITLKNIYDSVRQRIIISREILEGTNILLAKKLISTGEAGFVNDVKAELTDSAAQMLFGADAALFKLAKTSQNYISHKNVKHKQLFFNTNLQVQIDELTSSLLPDNFAKLQQRMLDNNMIRGVACIFYGPPGTGKTELVYQIAKATGRSIIHIDLASTKSMWFGESEKKVKEIFAEYAKACKPGIPCPILLFNEADGVLNRRSSNMTGTTDHTLNTIQNILLEQFEKNEGIIIATTNLVDNLDQAFERRFLLKIEFEKPNMQVMRKIWQSKLDWLDSSTLDLLATQFCLTGGEIDNIIRKIIMNEVVKGDKPSPEKIIDFCQFEKLNKNSSSRKLGFL